MRHFLLSTFFLFLSVATGCCEPVEILLAYEDTALPPFYLGEGEVIPEKPGIAVDILKRVDSRLDEISISFRRKPWERCKFELKKGKVDGIFPASFKPARMEIGVYPMAAGTVDRSSSLVSLSYYFYVMKGTNHLWDGGNFYVNGRIGVPTGYSVASDLKRKGYLIDDTAATTKQTLMKLAGGRVQAVAAQDVTADPIIRKEPEFSNIVKLSPAINTKPNYLIFSHQFNKKHRVLVERIWQTISIVIEEESLDLHSEY